MKEQRGLEALKELREMKANIDQAISALENIYATKHVEIREPISHVSDYSRMSLRAGALEAVLHSDKPVSTNEVVSLLMDGGLRSKSKAIGRTVYTTLYGLAKASKMAGDGKWVRK